MLQPSLLGNTSSLLRELSWLQNLHQEGEEVPRVQRGREPGQEDAQTGNGPRVRAPQGTRSRRARVRARKVSCVGKWPHIKSCLTVEWYLTFNPCSLKMLF